MVSTSRDKNTEEPKPETETIPATQEPIRRVYALPSELVERIIEFQKEKRLPSEVEAARRLLDEALKTRDTPTKVINRFLGRLENLRIASEVAKDVLVGHPMVSYIKFDPDAVTFSLANNPEVTITDDGYVTFNHAEWKWVKHKSNTFAHGYIDDGEIPF